MYSFKTRKTAVVSFGRYYLVDVTIQIHRFPTDLIFAFQRNLKMTTVSVHSTKKSRGKHFDRRKKKHALSCSIIM